MKTANLLENLKFGSKDPHTEPLHVDRQGRVILFTLKPEQSIREHHAIRAVEELVFVGFLHGAPGAQS